MLRAAACRLGEDLLLDARFSPVYESEPWGMTNQPKFLNVVIVGETDWKPPAIVNFLKSVERELGREHALERNGPRLIDLDLLLYGNQSWDSEGVIVPHPRMHDRAFVLLPLSDLVPGWSLGGKSISDWVATLAPKTRHDCNRVDTLSL